MIKNPTEFIKELEKINEWWITSQVDEAKRYSLKRVIFSKIISEMDTRRIIVTLGPRRVGKTVLMKQTIDSLIKTGINPRNILYYSLDDPTLFTHSDNLLKDMVDYFMENVAKDGRKYIFLDEIQLYEGWHKWIKAYYDRTKDIKFIVSGSSSLILHMEANKYLKGRTLEVEMLPLSFREFLRMSGINREKIDLDRTDDLDGIEISKAWHDVRDAFNEYLLVGGFPEWFEINEMGKPVERWFDMLVSDVPKKAIYEDVVSIFNIKSPRILEIMFAFISANQSKVLSYEAINDVAGLDRATLLNYLEFLKSSYMIIEILKYAGVKEQIKAKKKFLVMDQGLRNAILKDYEVREDNVGFIIENVVGIHLHMHCKNKGKNLFYWRINGEVDFIIAGTGGDTIPVEVRYRKDPSGVKFLIRFMEKFKLDKGIVVTKDMLKREEIGGKDILFIPAWLFLLSV